jgi:hypothetical protein
VFRGRVHPSVIYYYGWFGRNIFEETLHPLQGKNDVARLNRPVRGDENTILRVISLHIGHKKKISGTTTISTLKLAHTHIHKICIIHIHKYVTQSIDQYLVELTIGCAKSHTNA